MIFRNAHLIFPDGIRQGLEVEVRNGKITAIGLSSRASSENSVDVGGNYLAPGFIDLHVHGALGRDTMDGSPEAFETICKYHSSGGTTALLLTTATAPIDALVRVVETARKAARTIRQIAGVHIEGPFISKSKPGAQRAALMHEPAPSVYAPLLQNADMIKRMTIAPELPGAVRLIDDLVHHQIGPSGGHSDAWEEQARLAFEHGMHSVTHTFNCMSMSR